ncbi:DUF222 domain-containing protein [Glycomyces luteolus]|uniref:DUF222 domain-containing protein n=1 Tax=Glycomyces luteolus TaxID=2670330 RepID=A0A9X3PBQ9_9ACTN|nr:HNH endonuclease signature motif containing protein [Glycomyces luteolus]MDA1360623.1 DUF222 domain-containing protein [Glycomyces luteolus]
MEVNQRADGMWDIEGLLTDDTGKLISNALKTAVPPPRQDEADEDGLLPRVSGRNAEALHQMAAAYGTGPSAPERHGHTATLNLTCDVETLRGEKTGRLPKLDGKTISLAKARLLACEAGVIPSVFDYSTGEAIELGRAKRLPNAALRRKLELEQTEGCAWSGCRAPISWTEAHHLEHWADGGLTTAENLILLCRFHHGRIHTGDWDIAKTGPGQVAIRHKRTGATDAEWEADSDLPNGQGAEEFSRSLKRQLDEYANWLVHKRMEASIARTREQFRESDAAEVKACRVIEPALAAKPATPVVHREDSGGPPFLTCPQRATAGGSAGQRQRSPIPKGDRAPQHVRGREGIGGVQRGGTPPREVPPAGRNAAWSGADLFVAARPKQGPRRAGKPQSRLVPPPPRCRCQVAARPPRDPRRGPPLPHPSVAARLNRR